MTMTLWHRYFGLALLSFLVVHLGNHTLLAFGVQAHIDAMEILRPIYRHPIVETVLLGGLIVQMVLGLRLIRARGRPNTAWAWAQVISGGYILFFLLQHVPSVLFGRFVLGLDTNVYFAAAVVHSAPSMIYFAPYYTLAVTALFTHLAAALHFALWPRQIAALWALPALGAAFGLWITTRLMDIDVPAAYLGL